METQDYAKLIPTAPPRGLISWLKHNEHFWSCGILKYKQVNREEADAYTYHYDFFADLRCDDKREKLHPALLYCTECQRYMLADYIPGKACHGYGVCSGVRMLDCYENGTRFRDGEESRWVYRKHRVAVGSMTIESH